LRVLSSVLSTQSLDNASACICFPGICFTINLYSKFIVHFLLKHSILYIVFYHALGSYAIYYNAIGYIFHSWRCLSLTTAVLATCMWCPHKLLISPFGLGTINTRSIGPWTG
jgi:hypothetical protein